MNRKKRKKIKNDGTKQGTDDSHFPRSDFVGTSL